MSEPRFLADDMLARLARWLRGAGLDVAYSGRGANDDELLRAARREGRIVLTRDQRFPGGPGERLLVESVRLEDQLVEVFLRFPAFDPLLRPFSRCMECNGVVRGTADPPDRHPDVTGPFTRCESCGRLFWAGTHVQRILAKLAGARERARAEIAETRLGEPPPFERSEFDAFLKEALRLIGFSWRGYRRVRGGLRTRVRRRLRELGLSSLAAYTARLRADPEERLRLGSILNVTVSRFFRDRGIWLRLPDLLFPEVERLAGRSGVRVWSLGCASGEEAFTFRMVWLASDERDRPLDLLASDLSEECLQRARRGVYAAGSIHNVPEPYLEAYFRPTGAEWALDRAVVDSVRFRTFDWRGEEWPGPFHLVLARNGPFTYLAEGGRVRVLRKILGSIEPGGFLWIGGNERLPGVTDGWRLLAPGLYRLPGPCTGPGEALDGSRNGA
jgi:chemotaxis protein methyltransferase CheR